MSTHANNTHRYMFVCFEKLYRANISSVEEHLPNSCNHYAFEPFTNLIYISIGKVIFINMWIYICCGVEYT